MKVLRRVGAICLAAVFVKEGFNAAREPAHRTQRAATLGLPQPELMVRINGGTMVAAGTLLALGVLPRPAALVLAGSLIPTTLAGHPYWQFEEPAARRQQEIHFLKNLSMLGAMLVVASFEHS